MQYQSVCSHRSGTAEVIKCGSLGQLDRMQRGILGSNFTKFGGFYCIPTFIHGLSLNITSPCCLNSTFRQLPSSSGLFVAFTTATLETNGHLKKCLWISVNVIKTTTTSVVQQVSGVFLQML